MVFSGIPFLYYFLPAAVICYFLTPAKARNGVLLAFSLLFYGWSGPKHLLLMALTTVAFYALGLAQGRTRRRWPLVLGAALGAGLLAVFKYADFLLDAAQGLTGLALPRLGLALPVGISFYTFQGLSYLADVYQGRVVPERRLARFGLYISFFPQLIAGPIVRYSDMARELESRECSWQGAGEGLRRFLIGLGKKVLLADNLAALVSAYRQSGEKSVLFGWLYALAFSLELYYDFSGYSDMAIGLGRIFGFRFPENFRYPFLAESVADFWRRWHMTLGSWFRDYVYIPLGGSRAGKRRWVRNLLVVWLLTGLWHGAGWNFILWGLLFALALMAEKILPPLPKIARQGLTLLIVILSFVLFNAASLGQAREDLAGMLGLAGLPAISREGLYYLRSNAVLLLAGIAGASPLPAALGRRLAAGRWGSALTAAFLAGLLILCTAYLVDGSFSPFLYFRF